MDETKLGQSLKKGLSEATEHELLQLKSDYKKMKEALEKIANEDFRGNRPWGATIAYAVLKELRYK
jgi:hypothetical protein